MSEPISVMVEALPSDPISFYVSIISGIVVPILLLGITLYVTHRAEVRAISHAERMKLSDRKQQFMDNAHLAIDNLYKSIQTLRHINLKRKKHEEWSRQASINNEIIMSGNSEEAKLMQQDMLKWHLESNLELESEQGSTLIDVVSAQTRVQHLLTEQVTSALDLIIKEICDASSEAGMISEEMSGKFVEEINKLMSQVESNPDKWVKP
ncbi:MAG: hypothetical protein AB2556_02090 [Candidatus Thiodiazotropha sp.]